MANLYDQANQRQKWDQTIAQVQKMGYPQNPAQPPAFSPPAPRRPTSFGDAAAAARNPGVAQISPSNIFPQGHPSAGRSPYVSAAPVGTQLAASAGPGLAAAAFPNTTRAIGGAMDDARSAYQQGGLGAALGQSARVMGAPLIGLADDVATGAKTVLGPAAQALKTFATGDATPIGQAEPARATSGPATNAGGGAGRGMVNPAFVNPAAPAPTIAANPNNVTKTVGPDGRVSYSGGPNISGDITVNGKAPGGGFMVADSLASRALAQPAQAPQAQGVTAPNIQHSGNSWKAENDLRNARVSASSITANGGRFDQTRKGQISPQAATYAAMLGTDQALQQAQPGMAQAAMRENAGIQREGMQQTGANQRAGMGFQTAQQRLAMDQETQGFANRAAQQSEQLRNTLLDPNATPEQRKQAQQALMTLQGKSANGEWGVQVTPATKNIDGSTSAGSIVRYNKATGQTEVVPQGGQGQQLPTVNGPDDLAKLPKGAQFIGPDGKTRTKN